MATLFEYDHFFSHVVAELEDSEPVNAYVVEVSQILLSMYVCGVGPRLVETVTFWNKFNVG